MYTTCLKMKLQETTVKVSKWLIDEVDKFINLNQKNSSEFPSKKNLVDRALITFLESKKIKLNTKRRAK